MKQPKPNNVRTRHYNCAYVRLIAVPIIFPDILQTVINLITLSIGEDMRQTNGETALK